MASRKRIPHSRHPSMRGKVARYEHLSSSMTLVLCRRGDSFRGAGASVMLVRKQQIGEKWINFLQAVVNVVASARDGACNDMSRLKGLQCCNNLLFFRELQVQVSCEAESVINAFKSSATSDNALIVTEWSLLLKNISVVLLKHRVSETDEKNVLTCANASLDILRSAADPSGNDASLSVWNAIAAVATCSYYSPALRASIASARAEVSFHSIILLYLQSHLACRKRWFELSTSNATGTLRRQLQRKRGKDTNRSRLWPRKP